MLGGARVMKMAFSPTWWAVAALIGAALVVMWLGTAWLLSYSD
jgi:hypothetical protein